MCNDKVIFLVNSKQMKGTVKNVGFGPTVFRFNEEN